MNDIRIIINADDCGKNETVNKAIEKCIMAGKLSSTTVMATGEDIVIFGGLDIINSTNTISIYSICNS